MEGGGGGVPWIFWCIIASCCQTKKTNSSDIDSARRHRHGQSCFTFHFVFFRKLSRKNVQDKLSRTDHTSQASHLETVVSVPGCACAGWEQHRLAQEAPVSAAELAQQPEGDGPVVERRRPEVVAERRHHVGKDLMLKCAIVSQFMRLLGDLARGGLST